MTAAPRVLQTLAGRFDPDAFDAPAGTARLRLQVTGEGEWDAVAADGRLALEPADPSLRADARLAADAATWRRMAVDMRGGMDAFRSGALTLRDDLHLGVGFLAATSGLTEPGRLEVGRERTALGDIAVLRAGAGEPVVMLHGLGGTKASFLPSVAALARSHRVIALDLPGFGDSVKPLGAALRPAVLRRRGDRAARRARDRARAPVGNSMGGRVALELGFLHPERTGAPRAAGALAGVAARAPLGAARAGAAPRAGPAAARPPRRWSSGSCARWSRAGTTAGARSASTSSCART